MSVAYQACLSFIKHPLRKLGDADASVSENAGAIWRILGAPATPKQMRERMTPEARQELDELKSKRDANVAGSAQQELDELKSKRANVEVTHWNRPPIKPTYPVPPPTATAFWVYEDDPTNRARVHRGDCRYCNHGKGTRAGRLSDNRWHGPYATSADAFAIMRRLGKRDTGGCGTCRP